MKDAIPGVQIVEYIFRFVLNPIVPMVPIINPILIIFSYYSTPQFGKSKADSYSGIIKAWIAKIVNTGKQNCTNESELFECIRAQGGPANVNVQLGSITKYPDYCVTEVKNIRSYNTFRFEPEGIR